MVELKVAPTMGEIKERDGGSLGVGSGLETMVEMEGLKLIDRFLEGEDGGGGSGRGAEGECRILVRNY